jgi:hypothetical protein
MNHLLPKSLKTKKDRVSDYQSQLESFVEAHLDIRDPLGEGIYLLKNGDLGAVYKIDAIYDEPLTHNELEEKMSVLMKSLRSIVQGVPSYEKNQNTVVGVHLRSRSYKLEELLDGRHDSFIDKGLKDLLIEEEKYLHATRNLVKKEVLLSIRFEVEDKKENKFLKKAKKILRFKIDEDERYTQFRTDLVNFKDDLKNIKYAIESEFSLLPIKDKELIEFYQGYFDPKGKEQVYSGEGRIDQKIVVPGVEEVLVDKKGKRDAHLKVDQMGIKVFYIDQLPEEFYYGQLKVFLQEIPCNDFDTSWIISNGTTDFTTELAAKEGWYSRKESKQVEAEQLEHFRTNISSTKPHVFQSIRLVTYDLSSDQEGLLYSVTMDYLGARLVKETQIPLHMYATSMPLNCQSIQNKLKGGRCKRIRLENALAFIPIFNGPKRLKGSKNWPDRYGGITSFDLFAGEGNKMTSILAMSRGGKSVLNANLIIEFLAKNKDAIVRVIDKKSSYQKLSDLIGGRVISFSETSLKKNPYSPFALDSWDEDDIENVYILISTALVQKNKDIVITACHGEVLRESIKMAYNNHLLNYKNAKEAGIEIDPHPIWNDILSQMPQVCENLRSSGVKGVDVARDDLAKWSVNLYQTGQYGFLFSSYEKVENGSEVERFLTYDLDGISDEVLRQLAAMMAFIKIGRDLAKLSRSVPKLIVFEELGMLVHGEDEAQRLMDEFIHMVIKTCAKLNAQAIAITNDVKDYTEKAAGRTVWANSTQKIFLPLGDLIDGAKHAWEEKYNEADFQILESIKKEFHLKRSQAYVYSNNEVMPYKGTIFVSLSPFMDALCTTSGSQVEKYSEYIEEGMSPKDSLIKMAELYPFGEGLNQ